MTVSNHWVQQNLDSNGFKILGKSNSKHSNSSGFNSVVVEMQCSNKRRLFSFLCLFLSCVWCFLPYTKHQEEKRSHSHGGDACIYWNELFRSIRPIWQKKPSTFIFNLWNVWKANTNWLKAMKWFEKEYPLSCCHWKMRVRIRYAQ